MLSTFCDISSQALIEVVGGRDYQWFDFYSARPRIRLDKFCNFHPTIFQHRIVWMAQIKAERDRLRDNRWYVGGDIQMTDSEFDTLVVMTDFLLQMHGNVRKCH